MKATNMMNSLVLGAVLLGSGAVFATSTTSTTSTTASTDISRKDLASALINYEAASRMQDYMRDQQLMFMGAPATIWAIQAGAVIGASNTSNVALGVTNKSLVNSLGSLTKADKITLNGVQYPVPTQTSSPLTFYNSLQKYFTSGDSSNFSSISLANLLQTNNIAQSGSSITPDQAQALVNNLVDPFPALDPKLLVKIKSGKELSGQDMEDLGSKMASYSVVGASAMVLADMIARRTPASGQDKSIMQVMDEMSQERVKKTDWYNEIGAASEAALLREIAHMMAYNQWVAYQQFRVSEQQLALMASMNAVMAKTNAMIDKLNQSIAAAQSQAQAANAQLQQKLNESTSGQNTPVQVNQ